MRFAPFHPEENGWLAPTALSYSFLVVPGDGFPFDASVEEPNKEALLALLEADNMSMSSNIKVTPRKLKTR